MIARRVFVWFALVGIVLAALSFSARARAQEPLGSALDVVLAKKELRWGGDAQGGAPYVFQDPMDPNHLIGFEVEIAEAIAKKIGAGVRVRPVQGQWDKLLELVNRGDFDVVLNGIEVADEKHRVVELSKPYYVAPERLTVRRGDKSAPRTLEALKGRKVGTLTGTLAERILKRVGAEIKTYEGGQNDIYDDLRLGRTDAALLDEPVSRYYGEIDPALEAVPGDFGKVEYAVALRKDDHAMTKAVNQAIDALAADGTLAAIYARWGLWNEATHALIGGPSPPSSAAPQAFDAWRAAVGRPLPFAARVKERYPAALVIFLKGALMTLVVSIASMALAMLLGVVIALARVLGPMPLRAAAITYVEVFRGTPLLIQLTMIYFGLPELGITLHPFVAGVLALGLNYAAAEAENYRAGLGSVPQGQLDAARTLGLTRMQALRFVVGPQAFRVALPPMTNDFIALLKDSSLISVVTLTELTKSYTSLASATRDHLGLGLLVALVYLALSLPFARLARAVEARLGKHLERA